MKSIKLYRPVGLYELELIEKSGMKLFPPRLEFQPIFYPVLNIEYAIEIANGWNINDENSGYSGFVTSFEIPLDFFEEFEIPTVGSEHHEELWIPADELEELNKKIIGTIRIEKAFYGKKYNNVRRY